MVHLGVFPSKGQARKAGWAGPVPDGWSEVRVGKCAIFIWNPKE